MVQVLSQRAADPSLVDQKTIAQRLCCWCRAEETLQANEQHYEVPQIFSAGAWSKIKIFQKFIIWMAARNILDEAEINMLNLYLKRAGIRPVKIF